MEIQTKDYVDDEGVEYGAWAMSASQRVVARFVKRWTERFVGRKLSRLEARLGARIDALESPESFEG